MFVFKTRDHYYHHYHNIIADQRLHGRYHSPLSRALTQFTGALGQVVDQDDNSDADADRDDHDHLGVGGSDGVQDNDDYLCR